MKHLQLTGLRSGIRHAGSLMVAVVAIGLAPNSAGPTLRPGMNLETIQIPRKLGPGFDPIVSAPSSVGDGSSFVVTVRIGRDTGVMATSDIHFTLSDGTTNPVSLIRNMNGVMRSSITVTFTKDEVNNSVSKQISIDLNSGSGQIPWERSINAELAYVPTPVPTTLVGSGAGTGPPSGFR